MIPGFLHPYTLVLWLLISASAGLLWASTRWPLEEAPTALRLAAAGTFVAGVGLAWLVGYPLYVAG